jgi:hypothetical protein
MPCIPSPPVRIAAAALSLLFAHAGSAQRFVELDDGHLPAKTATLLFADFDGDGHPDALTRTAVLLNDGHGVFRSAVPLPPQLPDLPSLYESGDFDGDGDLDLFVAVISGQNRLLLNDGTAHFTEATSTALPPDTDPTRGVEAADLDGDGDLDVITANFVGANRIYVNDGTGLFSFVPGVPIGNASFRAAAADFDGDGDLDVTLGTLFSGLRSFRNDGGMLFTETTSSSEPGGGRALAFADVDGDGDQDLFVGAEDFLSLRINDGTGVFTNAADRFAERPGAPELFAADIDGDGDQDLFTSGGLHRNDGTGNFTLVGLSRDVGRATAVADLDGDGDLDLGLADDVMIQDATGTFRETSPRPIQNFDEAGFVIHADIDGDGDLDLVTGNARSGVGSLQVLINDGTASFRDESSSRLPAIAYAPTCAALADFDNDSDLDLYLGQGGADRLLLNDGTGVFVDVTATSVPAENATVIDIQPADVDGDGDLDLLVAGSLIGPSLLLNDGNAVFTDASASLALPDSAARSAPGDFDNDGDLDVFVSFAQGLSVTELYVNDGNGNFTAAAGAVPPSFQGLVVSVSDFDGDGDLDVFGGVGVNDRRDRLFVNNGTGTFTEESATRMPLPWANTRDAQNVDIDDDGDTDIVLGCGVSSISGSAPSITRILINDGAGVFTYIDEAQLPPDLEDTTSLVVADLDDDQDLDIAVRNSGAPTRLYTNVTRQLETPRLARPGRPYDIVVYSHPVTPSGSPSDVAVVFAALDATRIPLGPLGLLLLDPASLIEVGALTIPQPEGRATTSFVLPADPTIVGITLQIQACVVVIGGTIATTNRVADPITD